MTIPSSPRRILVQRADKLGDVILILPVLQQLKSQFPDLKIDVLTSSIGALFLQEYDLIDQLWVVDVSKKKWDPALAKILKEQAYDIYLALWDSFLLGALAIYVGISCRIGDKSHVMNRFLYTHTFQQTWSDLSRHQLEFNQELLAPFGLSPLFKQGDILIQEEALHQAKQWVQKFLIPTKEKILFFMGTGGTNYPIPLPVIESCLPKLKEAGYGVILCGEHPVLSSYSNDEVLNLTGKTSLKELAALIQMTDYYVGADTGPTHLASFLRKPLVFFSSRKTNPPTRWGPLSPYQRIIRKEYPCPYDCHVQCHPDRCFRFLTADYLYETLMGLIQDVREKKAKSFTEIKQYHLHHTFRGLVITKKSETSGFSHLNHDGLSLFLFEVDTFYSFKTIARFFKAGLTFNINVVIGACPFWLKILTAFYWGTYKALTPPIFISMMMNRCLSAQDILKMAVSQWQKKNPPCIY